MEKQVKIILVILVANIFIGSTLTKANYAVTAGQVYTYDVTESEWDYTCEGEVSTGTGFKFEDKKYSLDDQIAVTVNATDNSAIEYIVNVGTESADFYTSGLSIIGILFLLYYPYLMVQGLENHIKNEAYLGLGLQGLYFIEPTVASAAFAELADDLYIASEYVNDDSMTYNYVNGIFDTDDNIASFTWRYDTRMTDWTDETDFQGQFTFIIEYDQTTGVLQRYRMVVDYSGVWGYDSVAVKSIQEIELHNSNQNGAPGFSWYITIPAIAIVGLVSIVIKKRRKK